MADANLVFVGGASPQIVTETVFRLASGPAVAIDIHILTTITGREALRAQLLGRGGQWSRFLREYPRARRFRLVEDNILVLRDAAAAPLSDVRSVEDNLAAADQIARFVADHTGDGAPPLHASIAGGRKTMGYLLAAAMMFYGRHEDRLSHVLVHPAELEGTDFYFPPRRRVGRLSYHRPDGSVVKVAAGEVRIDLADLPFPRLRAVLPPAVSDRPFSAVVHELQSVLDALGEPRLSILPPEHLIVCGDRRVRLPPLQLAIYELLAERRKAACGRAECGVRRLRIVFRARNGDRRSLPRAVARALAAAAEPWRGAVVERNGISPRAQQDQRGHRPRIARR